MARRFELDDWKDGRWIGGRRPRGTIASCSIASLPVLGSRRLAVMLTSANEPVNRNRVRRLMSRMGIAALGPKPNTSKPAPGHKICPYLLRDKTIDRANQVWAADTTYVPLVAWRLSNTMDLSFCVSAAAALAQFGTPEIFNTDQGSQFTSPMFTATLAGAGIKISMDGRGRWMDNVFIERLWRSLKYEDIYLKGYADGHEARDGIAAWINFYNHQRPHQALGNRTPMTVWREGINHRRDTAVDMRLRLDKRKRVAHVSTAAAAPAEGSLISSMEKERYRFQL